MWLRCRDCAYDAWLRAAQPGADTVDTNLLCTASFIRDTAVWSACESWAAILGRQRWTWNKYLLQMQSMCRTFRMCPALPAEFACRINFSIPQGYKPVAIASGEQPAYLLDSERHLVIMRAPMLTFGHSFCSLECIRQWSRSSPEPRCPLCNASFTVLVHSGTEEVGRYSCVIAQKRPMQVSSSPGISSICMYLRSHCQLFI